MFKSTRSVCALVAALTLLSSAGGAQERRITIEEAVQTALSNHPDIKTAAANTAAARGELRTARSFVNPEIGFSIGPDRGTDTSLTSFELGVGQLIEIGGKRSARSGAASARLRATDANHRREVQLVELNVRRAFALVLVAQQRVLAAAEADTIGTSLVRAAEERVDLGVGTLLEINVAAATAARDKRVRLLAEQELTAALFDFRASLGLPAEANVVPDGTLDVPRMPSQNENDLVAVALSGRLDLTAIAEELSATESERRLARALAWPDPVLGFTLGRDDFRSRQLTLGIALPLWNRAGGSRAVASANLDRARTMESAARNQADREVREAYRALSRAIEAASSFERDVVARLSANLGLARESFENGKISLITYNTVRRELVAARLEYFDALTDVIERRFQLAAATGGAWE